MHIIKGETITFNNSEYDCIVIGPENSDRLKNEDEVLEESESAKVIEALQRLQDRKKKYMEKGESHPLFLAMMDDLDAV